MSFSSLKKSTLSDRPHLITVDQFIDDAVAYANGVGAKQNSKQLLKVVSANGSDQPKMRRSTFTLNEASIDALSELAERTGISRSRIIRIMVQHQLRKTNDRILLDSTLK